MINQLELETIEANPVRGFTIFGLGGGVALVTPFAATLDDDQVQLARLARAQAAGGAPRVGAAIAATLQRQLGVSQEMHQEAVLAGAKRLADQQRRAKAEAKRAERLRVEALSRGADPEPNETVAYSAAQAEAARVRLEQVRAADKDRKGKGRTGEISRALGEIRVNERRAREALARQREHAWAERASRETLAQAQVRGEEAGLAQIVDAEGEAATVVRVSSRDGLATLYESGALTRDQYRAGRAYRLCFEIAAAGLKIANLNGAGGGQPAAAWGRSAAELRRAYLTVRLIGLDRAVGGDRRGERRLKVLRAVAGEGRTLRELACGSGDKYTRMRDDLIAALDIVVAMLGLANQER